MTEGEVNVVFIKWEKDLFKKRRLEEGTYEIFVLSHTQVEQSLEKKADRT